MFESHAIEGEKAQALKNQLIAFEAELFEKKHIEDVAEVKARIEKSLDDARSELTPADRTIVNDLWVELQNQA